MNPSPVRPLVGVARRAVYVGGGANRETMGDDATRANELLATARRDPGAVDAAAFRDLFDANDPAARRSAVDGLRVLTGHDGAALVDAGDSLAALLSDPDPEVRNVAAAAFADLGTFDAARLEPVAADLAALLDDEYELARWSALEALTRIAGVIPDAVRPFADRIVPFLDADAERVRVDAAACLAAVAVEHPETVTDAVPRLLDLLAAEDGRRASGEDGSLDATRVDGQFAERVARAEAERFERRRSVRRAAGRAVAAVARDDPDAVVPAAGDLAALLSDPDPEARGVAAEVLLALAGARPSAVDSHCEALARRLSTEEDAAFVAAPAVQALAALSDESPERVRAAVREHDSVDTLQALLGADAAPVRGSAAALLALVGDADPDAVAPAAERLHELRDDDADYVRAAANDALSVTPDASDGTDVSSEE